MVLAVVSKRFVGNRASPIALKSGICMSYGALCMIIPDAIVYRHARQSGTACSFEMEINLRILGNARSGSLSSFR